MSCTAPCLETEIRDSAAFSDLRGDWEDLLQRSYDNRIFLSPTWQGLWWSHFGSGNARIVTHRSETGSLQAVLPLQLAEIDGTQALTLIGDYNVSDYMDGAAERDGAGTLLTTLWRVALDCLEWTRIRLRHVPSSSPLVSSLQTAASERGLLVAVERDEVCPVSLLCSSWDGYLQMLTKKQRHEVRRKLRRAEEGAHSEWKTVSRNDDLEAALEGYFRLHQLSANEKAGFMTPAMRGFFRDLAAELFEAGVLRLSFFSRDGVDLATTMSFLYRDRFLLYNSGYDPAFAEFSPGIAAVAHAVQDAIAERAVAFDFLSGDEPYKYQFGATSTYTCKISVDR